MNKSGCMGRVMGRGAAWVGGCAVGLAIMVMPVQAQERSQTRSMVLSTLGIVASENPLASQAGVSILARGGNAVDAAIAANAVMGLVAPMSNGVGGDLFAIVYEAKTGKLYGLNAGGWAPRALTPAYLLARGMTQMPVRGVHSITVPGAVDGWAKLLGRFGRLDFAQVLAPAITLADGGVPVTELVSELWRDSEKALAKDAGAAAVYLMEGRAPRMGQVFKNPDLAWTYRQIATRGRDGFYSGEVARRLVAGLTKRGGSLVADDLADYSSEWVEPISTDYRGWTVYELPPNTQGIAALEMLNIMEGFPLKDYGQNSARALHTMIEAKKLAYADMLRWDGDPQFSRIPVAGMLSKAFAAERARLISPGQANCKVPAAVKPPLGADTIYLSVVDKEGTMVSLIQSNYLSVGFGSGIVAEGTGFTLQNRGALFTLEADSPNVLAGRKRSLHTIIPGFMQKGDLRLSFGIMGGWNQSQAHAQFVSNVADFGMNIQAAVEAPRFSKESFDGCDVQVEARLPEAVRTALGALGHQLKVRGDFAPGATGGGQVTLRDLSSGVNYGASDPRKDGAAVAESF